MRSLRRRSLITDMLNNKLYSLLGRGIKFRHIIDDSYQELISRLDMTGVTDISDMFLNCKNLSKINLDSWYKESFVNLSHTFNGCVVKNGIIDLSKWDFSRVTSLNYTFAETKTNIILPPGFKNEVIKDLYCTWYNNLGVKRLDLSNLNTSKVNNYGWVFNGASLLEWLDISAFDLSNATSITSFFGNNQRLKHLIIGENFGKYKGTQSIDMSMFASLDDESRESFMTLYDRKSNGLSNMKLIINTSYGFTNEQIQTLTNKGYTINLV